MSWTHEDGLTDEQKKKMNKLIVQNDKETPYFYEEGVCDIIYVPVEGGELRVFHHKPKKPKSKRPVLFIPGFGTSPWSWRHFGVAGHERIEYYFIESREKGSSRIKKRFKAKMDADQTAKDIAQVISFLGLKDNDFVLYGASYVGGAMLMGLAKKYFTAPTIINFDPLSSWKKHRKYVYLIAPMPPFVITLLKSILIRTISIGMKNKSQKARMLNYIEDAVAWKWRRSGIQNFRYDIWELLKDINEEVSIFHGPHDRYHPHDEFMNMAKGINKGRYFYINTPEEYRELIAGIIASEYAQITRNDDVPDSLKIFEVELIRKKLNE